MDEVDDILSEVCFLFLVLLPAVTNDIMMRCSYPCENLGNTISSSAKSAVKNSVGKGGLQSSVIVYVEESIKIKWQ